MLSGNHSFFYVPFKIDDVKAWKESVEANTYRNRNNIEVKVWEKIRNAVPVHLMKFVNDGVGYDTERQYAYKLAEKRAFGLPYTDGKRKILSSTIKRNGVITECLYDIKNIKVHCFGTGVGFLVYDVWYAEGMCYEDILEFNYSFKKMGITGFRIDGVKTDVSEKISYLYNLSRDMITNGTDCGVEMFFHSASKVKMQCNVFSIYCDENDCTIDDMLFHFSHSYNKEYKYNKEINGPDFTAYHPYSYVHWGYCQDGIACVYHDINNFTRENLSANLQNDYYFMYIILLHQRFMLIKLLEEMMLCKRENMSGWKKIQNDLLAFRMEYSFNVVSDEMPYHHIYSDMRKALSVNEFENDIGDVSDKMYVLNREEEMNRMAALHEKEQNAADLRSWRTDIVLGLLSLLTVFSALVDSTDVINEWYSKEEQFVLLKSHILSYSLIAIVMIIVTFFLVQSYKQYRDRKKEKQNNG